MSLNVAIQMDPIGPINISADSTFRIAVEAQARGHRLFYYTPDRLAYREGRVLRARLAADAAARGRQPLQSRAPRPKSTLPTGMWSGCARIRPST